MKRWSKALLALILVMAVCGPAAHAAGETHFLEGKGIEITEPEGDYYILYRGMDPDDPVLAAFGMTAQQLDETMESDNTYLVAVARDGSYQIRVGVLEGEAYEGLTDSCMLGRRHRYEISAQVAEGLKQQGFALVGGIIWYEEADVPYMVYEGASTEDYAWSYQFQTMYNGRAVVICANSAVLDGPTDYIREETKRMAECVRFPYRIRWMEALSVFWDDIPWADIAGGASVVAIIALAGATTYYRQRRKKRVRASNEEPWERTGGDDL